MLDISCVTTPETSVGLFRAEATQWTLARDRYLSRLLPLAGLVEATRHLLACSYRAVMRVKLTYSADGDNVLTEVVMHTRKGEEVPLPSFDCRLLPHDGPPWFTEPAMAHVAAQITQASFDETARVLSDWFDGITADYDDVLFTMLALAFVARDCEGALTELVLR
jgi:hypothetical protein